MRALFASASAALAFHRVRGIALCLHIAGGGLALLCQTAPDVMPSARIFDPFGRAGLSVGETRQTVSGIFGTVCGTQEANGLAARGFPSSAGISAPANRAAIDGMRQTADILMQPQQRCRMNRT